jgi:hypothetical protein
MKKLISLACFVLIIFDGICQSKVIYANITYKDDIEHSLNKLKSILSDISMGEDFVLFISNGSHPYIADTMNEVVGILDEIKYYRENVRPSFFLDVDSLNVIISNSRILSNINSDLSVESQEITFCFILDPEDAQIDEIVYKLLLSNRLFNSDGLMTNCTVEIYLECNEQDKNCLDILKNYKKLYNNYEIYLY